MQDTEFIKYQYVILRYVHDIGAGESLNVGIIMYSPEKAYLKSKISSRYSRLSNAFASFDSNQYTRVTNGLEASIRKCADELQHFHAPDVLRLADPPSSLRSILSGVWGDPSVSYQFGEILRGITDDLDEAFDALFAKFVSSQYEAPKRPRRSDEQVWTSVYQDVLRRERITDHLQGRDFKVGDFVYRFDHAFKNGNWHALQPVTMDYADTNGIRDRIDKIIGESQVLSRKSQLERIYFLMGKPSDPNHLDTYNDALALLEDTLDDVLDHQIVREEDAEQFAKQLARYMENHGLVLTKPKK